MSSQLGLVSARNKAAYSTVKFGIIGLTKVGTGAEIIHRYVLDTEGYCSEGAYHSKH